MVTLEEVTTILQNDPLAFRFAILIGLILIIIAIAPSLNIPLLKISALTLSKKQSIILGAVGVILILGGFVGLSQMNMPPVIYGVTTIPPEIVAQEDGIPINICIKAEDPDSNNTIQNMFSRVTPLQYDFSFKSPATGYRLLHDRGPDTNNIWTWWVYPAYAGNKAVNP